jgi:hypothetical protein
MTKTSRIFVRQWTKSPNQNFKEDNRGWKKGKARKRTKAMEEKIEKIYQDLDSDPEQFYTGPSAITLEWRKRYSDDDIPSLRTIGLVMADKKLSGKRKKGRNKGAARYLCYPEYTIYTLFGGRVAESDFIGKKFITGRTEPINFISFCFKKMPKLRYFQRVEAQTADCFIAESKKFFQKFEKPDYLKVDNCLAAIGSASVKRNISRTMKFLLGNQVIPIFSVPRKPFSQASIEGNNSVFSRKFWNKINFKNVQEIDKRLKAFNKCSEEYCGYERPENKKVKQKDFIPKVYFIRQVKENKETGKATINVLNEEIKIRKSYIQYFVLAEWNLKEEMLFVYFEKEQKQKLIKRQIFKINSK